MSLYEWEDVQLENDNITTNGVSKPIYDSITNKQIARNISQHNKSFLNELDIILGLILPNTRYLIPISNQVYLMSPQILHLSKLKFLLNIMEIFKNICIPFNIKKTTSVEVYLTVVKYINIPPPERSQLIKWINVEGGNILDEIYRISPSTFRPSWKASVCKTFSSICKQKRFT